MRLLIRQEYDRYHFTTLVCDLLNLPDNYREEASKDNPYYYFRPWKTMLVRTVADGGESFYVKGRHAETMTLNGSGIRDIASVPGISTGTVMSELKKKRDFSRTGKHQTS